MEKVSFLLILTLLIVLWGEFVNGWTDAPNAITTIVVTRVLSPFQAVMMATVLNMVGVFSGTAVAKTIGEGIIKPEMINLYTVAAAVVGIIIWSTLAWRYGLPTSESHGLIAGLAGAGLAFGGTKVLQWEGWKKVIIGLFFSTFLGFFLASLIFLIMAFIFQKTAIDKTRKIFGKLQIFSSAFMAFSHGSNDGQKFMGVFTLALMLGGVIDKFVIPLWVIVICGVVMAIGTLIGGWRIVKTLGIKLTRLEPQDGFAAETAAASAIEIASRLGIPLSTTHTISTAIMGVGAMKRTSSVRWLIAREVVIAWILTFPICGVISFATTKAMILFFSGKF